MARTNKDRKVYIAVTSSGGSTPSPQASDLTKSQFEALNWTEIHNVGAVGEAGTNTNIVSYDELATDVTQKAKGISNAGDPTIECARNPTDLGQIAMRAAALTNFSYAFKFEDKDAPDESHTNSIYYNRGLVTGPTRPNGRNEDFILEVFTLALNQKEIVVDPAATVAPVFSRIPAIAGIAQTGVVLTAIPGITSNEPTTRTYQWQADDAGNGTFADVAGAIGISHTPAVGNVGDAWRVEETAVNAEGTPVVAYSAPTQVQIAA